MLNTDTSRPEPYPYGTTKVQISPCDTFFLYADDLGKSRPLVKYFQNEGLIPLSSLCGIYDLESLREIIPPDLEDWLYYVKFEN